MCVRAHTCTRARLCALVYMSVLLVAARRGCWIFWSWVWVLGTKLWFSRALFQLQGPLREATVGTFKQVSSLLEQHVGS